jgi:hypothetical protein
MKKLISILLVLFAVSLANGQTLKPYILGSTFTGSMDDAKTQTTASLQGAGFTVVGQYMPVADANRWIIIVSHPALDKAVKTVGGLTGFASTLRLGLTKEDGVINISYTNPVYWGNAYFRDDFEKVSREYSKVEADFKQAVSAVGTAKGSSFGSEKGVELDDLRKYHYMFGMPYFDETEEFGDFNNHEEVIAKIETSLKWGKPGIKLVYKYEVQDTKLTLFGFSLDGESGESNFMPKIDLASPKHTAFLPYEFLVMDNEVHMLHGRFRIALSFPDLTMGTFTKIMSSPGDIEDLLKQLVE